VALGAVGVATQAWAVVEGLAGRIAWVVDLQDSANPIYRAWRLALPDYLAPSAGTWLLHWAWAALALGVAAAAFVRERGAAAARMAHAPA